MMASGSIGMRSVHCRRCSGFSGPGERPRQLYQIDLPAPACSYPTLHWFPPRVLSFTLRFISSRSACSNSHYALLVPASRAPIGSKVPAHMGWKSTGSMSWPKKAGSPRVPRLVLKYVQVHTLCQNGCIFNISRCMGP